MAFRHHTPASAFALAFTLGLPACAGDDAGGDAAPSAVVDTVAGVERLSYGAERAGDLGWTVADTVAVIGSAMAEPEYQFGGPSPMDLAGTATGGIILVDRDGTRVLEYGPGGEHVATYGRGGEGPGELQFPMGLDVGPGDTVWVNDLSNRRLTGFPRGGGEPRTVPYPRGDVFPGSQIEALGDGFLQVMGSLGQRLEPGQAVPEPLLRLDRGLQPQDTLWVRQPDVMDMVELDLEGRSIVIGVSREFFPQFHWQALAGGGVVVADSADYVFRIVDDDGAVRRIVRRDPPARTTADADREAARRAVLEETGFSLSVNGSGPDAEGQRRMAEARADAMTFHDRIPRIVALRVDPRDRIWVGVSEDTAKAIQRIDVYDPDGTLLGELRGFPMPSAFTGDDRIVLTRRDELDVPQVILLTFTTDDAPR